jgi:hypothetical protein
MINSVTLLSEITEEMLHLYGKTSDVTTQQYSLDEVTVAAANVLARHLNVNNNEVDLVAGVNLTKDKVRQLRPVRNPEMRQKLIEARDELIRDLESHKNGEKLPPRRRIRL